MQRMITYRLPTGAQQVAVQMVPTNNRDEANRLLADLATANGWLDVEAHDPAIPAHEIRRRANEVQAQNGLPPLYTEEQTRPPAAPPVAPRAVVKDLAGPPASATAAAAAPVVAAIGGEG